MKRKLKVKKLTAKNFSPFGDVIEPRRADRIMINEKTTERFHDLANVDISEHDGFPLINIFRGQPRSKPIEIRMMERHPLGSQAFIPLQNNPYLVVVAPISDNVIPSDIQAFIAAGNQGVNYKKNLWHHPLLVLKENHDFLVVDRGGGGENCEEKWFTEDQGSVNLVLK